MLKLRIMPTMLHKGFSLVKGVGFDSWRPVGTVMQFVKVYNMREVDELVFLDIAASEDGRRPDFAIVDEMADECFMPLTVGGGVRSVDDVQRLLEVGADKVAINSAAVEQPELVSEAASRFGSQCVVVSIDAKLTGAARHEVYTHNGKQPTGLDPVELAKTMAQRGAGEILLTSVDRDGTMNGYDVELVSKVSRAVPVPVIASGGAGSYQDMADVIEGGGASAVAAASIFHFTQQTPREAKIFLKNHGIAVRL